MQAEIPVASLRLSDEDETHFFGALSRLTSPPKAMHKVEDAYQKLRGFGDAKCALIAGADRDTFAAATFFREAVRYDPRNSQIVERAFVG